MQIAVCDDEEIIRTELPQKLKALFPDAEINTYADAKELLHLKKLPDILLLDIVFKDISGMDAARLLRERDESFILIFITMEESFVYDSFDVGAFNYLVKPVSDEKLFDVMRRAADSLAKRKVQNDKYIMINHGGLHTRLNIRDIVYAEVLNAKVTIHTVNQDIEYYGKLGELEHTAGKNFFRTHRSYLVNLRFVKSYSAGEVYLKRGTALMSKRCYPLFKQRLMDYNLKRGVFNG